VTPDQMSRMNRSIFKGMLNKFLYLIILTLIILVFIPFMSGFEGESANFNISGSVGYGSKDQSSANYNLTSFVGDYPVVNGSTSNYNLLISALYHLEPVLLDSTDTDGGVWLNETYSQTVTTDSFDYKNLTLKLHVCNETGFDATSGCEKETLCTDFSSKTDSSCSFAVGTITGNHSWYTYITDTNNVPAIQIFNDSYAVDATDPIGEISDINTRILSWDLINFSCTDAHSGCNDTFRYYFNDTGVCSDNLSWYNNTTTENNITIDWDNLNYLCLRVEDNVGYYNITVAQMRVDTKVGLDIGNIRAFDTSSKIIELYHNDWQNIDDSPYYNWTDFSNLTSGLYFYTFNSSDPTMNDTNTTNTYLDNTTTPFGEGIFTIRAKFCSLTEVNQRNCTGIIRNHTLKYDVTDPGTTDNSSDEPWNNWYIDRNASVFLNMSDATSGINYTYYCQYHIMNESPCSTFESVQGEANFTANITCSEPFCVKRLRYYSVDYANNSESYRETNDFYFLRNSTMENVTVVNTTLKPPMNSSNSTFIDSIIANATTSQCVIDGSRIWNFSSISCMINNSHINDTIMNNGTINMTTITDTIGSNAEISGSNFWDLWFSGVFISYNMLYVGSVTYNSSIYYATVNISNIYNFSSSTKGSLSFNATHIKNGSSLEITYEVDDSGYSATVNTTLLNSDIPELNLSELVSGTHRGSLNVTSTVTGIYNITATVRDPFNNQYILGEDLIIDNTFPTGSITINTTGTLNFDNISTEHTSSIHVILDLIFNDTYGVDKCRYNNDGNNYSEWEECVNLREWSLPDIEGTRTVYYQILDNAGNIVTYSDTIIYNKSGAGLDVTPPNPAIVTDDGVYQTNNTYIHIVLTNASDPESESIGMPVTFYYKVRDVSNSTVVSWVYIGTLTDFNITGLTLDEGEMYYVDINTTNGAGLGVISSSDGISLDSIVPSVVSVTGINISTFSNNNSPRVVFNATDATSGVWSYSYVLDSDPSTEPDDVPELIDTIQYTNMQDDVYYMHVKALDNAKNVGATSHYMFGIDIRPPSIPVMDNNISTNSSQVTFSWSRSTDGLSGIHSYYIQIREPDDSVFFEGNVGNVTSYTNASLNTTQTYFARVRARDIAGTFSAYSGSYETDINPPTLSSLKPSGYIASHRPRLSVTTDEYAECKYQETSPILGDEESFFFTNSTYHENKLKLNKTNTTYTYLFNCTDGSGNSATDSVTFSVLYDKIPDSLWFTDTNESTYIVNEISTIDVNLTIDLSGTEYGLGEADLDNFRLVIDNKEIKIAMQDRGAGKYEMKFEYKKAGTFTIKVYYGDVSATSKLITFSQIPVSITYDESGDDGAGGAGAGSADSGASGADSGASSGDSGIGSDVGIQSSGSTWDTSRIKVTIDNLMTYYDIDGRSTIGIGTDSSPMDTSSTTASLSLSANFNDGNQYIFLTNTSDEISNTERFLKDKAFHDLALPAFGLQPKTELYTIKTFFNYPGIRITSDDFDSTNKIKKGPHGLLIVNNGFDSDGKKLIEVKII